MDCSPQGSTGLLFPSAGHLPKPGMEPGSPALQADSLLSEPPGKSIFSWLGLAIKKKVTTQWMALTTAIYFLSFWRLEV